MTKSMIKTIIQIIIILSAAVFILYKFYSITDPNEKYTDKEKEIAEICKAEDIHLHLASVNPLVTGDGGYSISFRNESGVSKSDVFRAADLFGILTSKKYSDRFWQGQRLVITVYAAGEDGGGEASISNFCEAAGHFSPDEIRSVYCHIEEMNGVRDITDKLKNSIESVTLDRAVNINTYDFKDCEQLKELTLNKCTDGTKRYKKEDEDRFEFYNDDVIFTIS